MIHAKIAADGTLTLSADSELEVFALGEWRRLHKEGQATLQVDLTLMDKPSLRVNSSAEVAATRVVNALKEHGPMRPDDLAAKLGMARSSLYAHLARAQAAGLVGHSRGQWSVT